MANRKTPLPTDSEVTPGGVTVETLDEATTKGTALENVTFETVDAQAQAELDAFKEQASPAGQIGMDKVFTGGIFKPAITQMDLDKLSVYLESKIQAGIDEMKAIAATRENGITAQLVGGTFNCPECGLRLDSFGPITTLVKKKDAPAYHHPFLESPHLGGKQCRLIGAKFRAPVIWLERV